MYLFRLLAWVFVVACSIMGYTCLDKYFLTLDDVEKVEGVLNGDPTYTRDEDDTHNTSMHFYLEGQQKGFGIPGKVLAKAAFRIQDLKSGDAVDVYTQKNKKQTYLPRRLTFSIAKKGQKPLINIEEVISFFASPRFIFMAVFFWGMAVVTLGWLILSKDVKTTRVK